MDPADYAARQARFLRSSVFPPLDPDMGTAGILKVQVISAKNLRNADIIGASDPYVIVSVGLQSAQTHVIKVGVECSTTNTPALLASLQDNLNPTWNCTLQLPLQHAGKREHDDALCRFDMTTVLVLFGIEDPSLGMGFKKHILDFGLLKFGFQLGKAKESQSFWPRCAIFCPRLRVVMLPAPSSTDFVHKKALDSWTD